MAKSFLPVITYVLCILCGSLRIDASQRKEGGSRPLQYRAKPQIEPSKDWYKCDFESGYCGWRNDTAAEFEWYRTSQETPTTETGPRWDHTKAGVKGAGYYLYIETSVPQKNGDRARLISPTLQETGLFCFRFWHNMHGSDVKELNVKFLGHKSRKERTLLHLSGPWSVGRNSGIATDKGVDWWNQEFIEILVMEPINFIIEGLAGKNYKGDIGIDDINLEKGKCPRLSGNCDFENDTCGWTQMADDQFNWLPNRGKTQTSKTGPSNDHTLGTSSGRYLYIEASWPRVEGDKARLLSPKILCDNGASPVFNFWYHMYGIHSGPLKVYVTNDKAILGNAIWEKTGDQGDQWFLGQVTIFSSILIKGAFYVIIEAERKNFEGDIAIDDLSIVGCRSGQAGFGNLEMLTRTTATTTVASTKPTIARSTNPPEASLPDNINCNFDKEKFCGWEQLTTDDANWIRTQSKTPTSHTGPAFDHTTGKGWYVFMEASTPRKAGHVAVLQSRPINPLIQACVTFYYHMRGKTMGSLEVLTARTGDHPSQYKRKWIKQGQQSTNATDWKYGEVTITESEPYHLLFRATRGVGFNSDIALDDIKVYPNPCSNGHSSAIARQDTTAGLVEQAKHKAACHFNKSTCLWKQEATPNNEFDWKIASAEKSVSSDTAPSVDHTSGDSGNFIYIDASLKKKPGDSAQLISPPFNVDRPQCFRFWYHMSGAGVGNLTFYKKVGSKVIPLWRNGGDKGNTWYEGMIDLVASTQTILMVDASQDSNWSGDIALDDFDVTDGKCPSIDCDFEANDCGWTQDIQNDQFNWTRHSGPTRSMHTGPGYDHTLKDTTGTYLYIEASNRQRFDKAWIRSPIIDPKLEAAKCLTFWYHSFGENIGSLSVNKIQPNSNVLHHESNLWINEKNHGNQWVYGRVNVKDTLPYQIIIQGVVGLDYLGDIAIDDIQLKDGACDPCCDDSKFRCGNHFCIHKSQRCNGIDECGDESDESFCITAGQPECGMPFEAPAVVDILETSNNVHRDEAIFETFAIPEEDSDFSINYTDAAWKGAVKIPYSQASALKHIRFIENPSSSTRSETIEVARKKRNIHDVDDENYWVDIMKLQGSYNILKMKKKPSVTSRHSAYETVEKNARKQFGRQHEISHNIWTILRRKTKKSETFSRVKRSSNKKVIGGIRTSRLNYPWQVAYYITDSSTGSHYFCGGTLVHRYWVITAAHCPYLGDIHNIVLGDYDLFTEEGTEQEKLVDAIFIRNVFKINETLGDVALIKLRYPAKQSKSVQIACLLSDNQEPFKEGHLCVTTGWGLRSSSPRIERYLRQAQMPIVQPSICAAEFSLPHTMNESYICAGGNGANTCKGDSGGPLVCKKDDGRFYLAGITVWQGTRCSASTPGLFTKVQSFNEWIRRIITKYRGCKPPQ